MPQRPEGPPIDQVREILTRPLSREQRVALAERCILRFEQALHEASLRPSDGVDDFAQRAINAFGEEHLSGLDKMEAIRRVAQEASMRAQKETLQWVKFELLGLSDEENAEACRKKSLPV